MEYDNKVKNNRFKNKKRKFLSKIRQCQLCKDKIKYIDFLNVEFLSKFQTENGKILSRYITGTCAIHQRMIMRSIKRARIISLVL